MLKQLIQKLLDSRTTPEEAGHSAMPSTTKTIFLSKDETVGSWGILNAGIAPDDGYLFVNASAEDNTNSEVRAQLGNIFHVSAQAPAPKGLGVAIPVSKGATYSVEGAFVSHITVGFVKVIGGGYSAIEKLIRSGGALCLSNLYNSLRRSSLLTKRNGSVVMPFLLSRLQFLHEVQLHYQVTQQYHLLSRLTTAIYLHKFLPKAQTLKAYGLNTRVCDCGKVRLKEHGLEELFLSRKGLHSRSHSGTRAYKIPTSQLLSFTRASVVKTNFSVGGALC